MITYDPGFYSIGFVFALTGSVLTKSVQIALPAGLLSVAFSVLYHRVLKEMYEVKDLTSATSSLTLVMGFLIVFRCQIAYGRFWDGASYLQTIKSGWFNATSNLFAFCSDAHNKRSDVQNFQHRLVRLMSLMYSAALQSVSDSEFTVLDPDGLEMPPLDWASNHHDKLEVLMMWIQRLIVREHRTGTIDIAPPILSRVFQELSNGILDVSNAKRINRFPFPFPYAQMITLLLLSHLFLTVAGVGIDNEDLSVCFVKTFFQILSLWSINYIAVEIEMPFGSDANDLPMTSMAKSMNDNLALLLNPLLKDVPQMAPLEPRHFKIKVVGWAKPEGTETFGKVISVCDGGYEVGGGPIVDERLGKPPEKISMEKPPIPSPADVKSGGPGDDQKEDKQQQLAVTVIYALEQHFDVLARRIDANSQLFFRELREGCQALIDEARRSGDSKMMPATLGTSAGEFASFSKAFQPVRGQAKEGYSREGGANVQRKGDSDLPPCIQRCAAY